MKEKQIVYENKSFWVLDDLDSYSVMIDKITHSESESHYERNDDGLSIAKARCDYLAKRNQK